MINKQFLLFLSALLISTCTYAQIIQFNNGDILNVRLIRHTDTTITFFHPALGDQTIDKTNISNLQDLNLDTLNKIAEGDEGKAYIAAKIAKQDVLMAKQEVDIAKEQLIAAEATYKSAIPTDLNAANQAMIAATDKRHKAEKKLILAVDKANVAEKNAHVAKEVRIASGQVEQAKKGLKVAKAQVKAAQVEVHVSKKQEDIAKQDLDDALPANIALAEEKVEIAENQTGIAEEKVEVAEAEAKEAEEKVTLAKNQVKLAKGEKVHDGFLGTGWFQDWDSSISIGLSGTSGSSVNSTFRTAFNAHYEDKEHRWNFKSFYFQDSEDNKTGENQVNATLVKDWFFADNKWFAFATGVYDWNEFKDWNHRLQFGGGPGYQYIKTDTWEFSGRLGATTIFEFGKTQYDSDGNPIVIDGQVHQENIVGLEGLIGADLIWHITSQQHFSISNYFYPSFTNGGQFRNLTNISWIHSIDWFEGLALKFGIRNEYDTSESIPNEFNYNLSILWGF